MFSYIHLHNAVRIIRAAMTNQVARLMPKQYLRLTGQTGRNRDEANSDDVTKYFQKSFFEYFDVLGIEKTLISKFLSGKTILEYGPGDIPAVSILMYAYGAERVYCVDRFPMVRLTQKNIIIMKRILSELTGYMRTRAEGCFLTPGNPASGLDKSKITYLVRPSGLSGLTNEIDLIISRAVLEHVDDLQASFMDMLQALRQQGLIVHKVDLRSHGLHQYNPLDFLIWSPQLWSLMYKYKGVPNRWRVDKYRSIATGLGFEINSLMRTAYADQVDIASIRARLAKPYQNISDEDLSWLGFWMVGRKANAGANKSANLIRN